MDLLNAFLDGVTGAGLFGKLTWPGAPTELVDSRPLAEFNGDLRRDLGYGSISSQSWREAGLMSHHGRAPQLHKVTK